MTQEQKDAAWRSLPEKAQAEIRQWYSNNYGQTVPLCVGFHTALSEVFGKHNLTASEEEKPKFKVGDKVKVVGYQENCKKLMKRHVGEVGTIIRMESNESKFYKITCDNGFFSWREDWIEPYTEAETKEDAKDTKDDTMETKDETKELNLCELLKGHEGEYFYSPYLGNCVVTEIKPDESHNQIWLRTDEDIWCAIPSCGHEPDGVVMLFPSRTHYEQYPLDPYTAWMKWQQEQKKHSLSISYKKIIGAVHGCGGGTIDNLSEMQCDKAISEIKAIIEKYSKK